MTGSTELAWEDRMLPRVDNWDLVTRRERALRQQPYRAAIPARIAQLGFVVPQQTLADADDAARAIARFDAEYEDFPEPFSGVLLRSESASSSEIEHLTAGARAISEAEIDERVTGNAPQIVRNVRAMEAAVALADDIGHDTVIAMHRELLDDVTPDLVGRYREEQVWIGGALPHLAAFVPPHHDRVVAAMDDLIAFTTRTDLPLLVQAAVAHAQFETIHPFPDGNGRTGRALVQAILRRGGLLRHLTIPVSSGILTDVDAYFGALDAFRTGRVAPIVDVFSAASLSGLRNAERLAAEIRALVARWDDRLTGIRSDATARKVVRLSIEHPVLNARLVAERTGASPPVITNAFDQLVQRGLLRPGNSRQRNRIWVNDDVVDALDAFAERSGRRQQPGY
ncbi:Fic family protein [Curtobacterium sp. ISL-83]|uniref:Fic family protein n=1 Tax=Curtobacterium sp. ISL-83 TaxID=2819145 RepID=UPI001BE8C022|nr:Fic family protein [Curtobacterium sp. ISL-83]MBT2502241.1 Fic family protein [Curtobacterium sp. ISL-83]